MSQHHYGEGYSADRKVPTIEAFRAEEEARERAAAANASKLAENANDEQAPSLPAKEGQDAAAAAPAAAGAPKSDGLAEKERIKAAAQAPKEKPTDKLQTQGKRRVQDPVTGKEVEIEDNVDFDISTDKLESKKLGGFSGQAPKSQGEYASMFTGPVPANPTSILIQPFPAPLETEGLQRLQANFRNLAIALGAAMSIVWFLTAFGSGWLRFFLRTGVCASVGIGGWSALHIAGGKIEKDLDAVRAQMHHQRGLTHSLTDAPLPESVEWLNAFIATVWKQISPEMFVPMADTIEDIMQQSLPGFIDAVKVSDLTHGHPDSALRLTHMRGLADKQGEKEYPREEWIDQGQKPAKPEPTEGEKAAAKVEGDADGDGIADEDESGDFMNLEVGFILTKKPGQKTKSASLMLSFFIGAYDLFRFPLNVWAEVTKLSGTARLRIQFVAASPFVRNMTITMMGVPAVEVSVVPMTRALPSLLDLPMISGFVKSSIAAALNEYVAPKSMTLNLAEMLAGDGIHKDVDPVGVLVVHIQHASDLSPQDKNGYSDSYVVLSFAKFAKPLYSTRVIFEDLNPNFNETAFLLVTKDDLKNDESLSVQLWDSDAHTADDVQGRVGRPLSELTKGATLNQLVQYDDELMGFEDADKMQGKLHWRCGFFEKAAFNKALIKAKESMEGKSSVEKAAKEDEQKPSPTDKPAEVDALHCPPDPAYPCGILNIHIHHIIGLETRDVEKGLMGKEREKSASGQDVDERDIDMNLPNGYCEIALDDSLIYRTRVKMGTNFPIFEASTDLFVRDWTKARVRIIVRNSVVRELDPVMGIVDVALSDVFSEASSVTRYHPVGDGIGYGRVQATMVFRNVQIRDQIPRSLLGADTATVELLSAVSIDVDEEYASLRKEKIVVTTGDVTQRLSPVSKQDSISSDEEENGFLARLPVYDRHSSTLAFTFGGGLKIGPLGGKADAVAVASLCELVDEEIVDLAIPLLVGEKLGTLARNHIDEFTAQTHSYKQVGTLRVKVRVDPGLDGDHEKLAKGQTARHEFEMYQRTTGFKETAESNAKANDDGVITRKEQKDIDKAKSQALHARHRGVMGYSAARTGVWGAQGIKDRARKVSMKLRGKELKEREVPSEA